MLISIKRAIFANFSKEQYNSTFIAKLKFNSYKMILLHFIINN